MKKISVITAILLITLMTFFVLNGCTQNAAEKGNDFGIGKDEIKQPPDGWPSEVPINKDIILIVSTLSTGKLNNYIVSGPYKGSAEEIYNFYKSSLSGWTLIKDNAYELEGTKFQEYDVKNDKYKTDIGIMDDGKRVTVNIILSELENKN
jgi:hypothetical protein